MSIEDEFHKRIGAINTYRKGNQRAPHKPLYMLLLIASVQQQLPRLQKFTSFESTLVEALHRFGLSNKTQNAHYPFWRLQNDDIAEVCPPTGYDIRRSSDDPKKSSLIKLGAEGGFLKDYYKLLFNNLVIQSRAIHKILYAHFPPSIHEEILTFFDLRTEGARAEDCFSDSEFRSRILSTYGNTCALTGYSLHFRGNFPGLEAAHLCWPQVGGNDDIPNGISMTTLCRKLFHLGIIGIEPSDYSILISPQASDLGMRTGKLAKVLNKKISLPIGTNYQPSVESLTWHKRWVFKS